MPEGYSGKPLAQKLGIKPHSVVCLLGAPKGFRNTLGPLPQGVRLRYQARGCCDLVLWFVRSYRDLAAGIGSVLELSGRTPLWIHWPKKSSGLAHDLSENRLREVALPRGLVDCKVCSVDATWSGLLFKVKQ